MIEFSIEKYGLDLSLVAEACGLIISSARQREQAVEALFEGVMASSYASREFIRYLMAKMSEECCWRPAVRLRQTLGMRLTELLER